jgi:hypothetical protein
LQVLTIPAKVALRQGMRGEGGRCRPAED